MRPRHLDVTARTTLDLVEARSLGTDWVDDAAGVLDVESPDNSKTVALELELDPDDCEHVHHHADVVTLTPAQARRLAADLDSAAAAATNGESMTSGRSRSASDG